MASLSELLEIHRQWCWSAFGAAPAGQDEAPLDVVAGTDRYVAIDPFLGENSTGVGGRVIASMELAHTAQRCASGLVPSARRGPGGTRAEPRLLR